MFLAKLQVPLASVRNSYELHRIIWNFFPNMPDADRFFLFRVNYDQRDQKTIEILVQSELEPIASGKGSSILLAKKAYNPHFRKGQVLKFEVRTNPVRRSTSRETKKQVYRLIEDDTELETWFKNLLLPMADLLNFRIVSKDKLLFRTKRQEEGMIYTVSFEGYLVVSDPELLFSTVKNGIGRAKSFGCGLLSVARP